MLPRGILEALVGNTVRVHFNGGSQFGTLVAMDFDIQGKDDFMWFQPSEANESEIFIPISLLAGIQKE